MACDLTKGRAVPCKDVVGGIYAVYFVDFGDLGTVTLTNDEVTDISGTFSAYQYLVKGNSSFEQAFNSSRENGTTFFTQTLNLTLTKAHERGQQRIEVDGLRPPYVVVEDYNGNAFLMGKNYGAEVTGGTIVTGAAMGDLSGLHLTMEATGATACQLHQRCYVEQSFCGMCFSYGHDCCEVAIPN
jgi:hypothetical protein